jgi:hypothetical protein
MAAPWGTGPAGAGSAGISKVVLAVGLLAAIAMTVIAAREGRGWQAGVTAAAGVYFAARLFLGLGSRRRDDEP